MCWQASPQDFFTSPSPGGKAHCLSTWSTSTVITGLLFLGQGWHKNRKSNTTWRGKVMLKG